MAKQEDRQQSLQLLKNDIRQRQPARLYFFHGEETFLLNYYLQQLKKILVDELTESPLRTLRCRPLQTRWRACR